MAILDDKEVPSGWLRRQDAAKKLGCSLSRISRMVKADTLNPIEDDEGIQWFNPDEIESVRTDPDAHRGSKRRAEDFAEFELSVIKDLVDLVKVPREKTDEYMFKVLDRYEKQNERLMAQNDKMSAEVKQARESNAEHDMAVQTIKSETELKSHAIKRVIDGVTRFLTGGSTSGVTLNPDQLEELIVAGGFLNPEQENAAKSAIMIHKQNLAAKAKKEASTNGDSTAKVGDNPTTEGRN